MAGTGPSHPEHLVGTAMQLRARVFDSDHTFCGTKTFERIRCVRGYIDAHLGSNLEVAELARVAKLSPHHFSMLFKQIIGLSPHQYVLYKRICEAQRQLAAGRLTLSEVALNLGFSDQSHFSRAFRKIAGTTPTRYARKAADGKNER